MFVLMFGVGVLFKWIRFFFFILENNIYIIVEKMVYRKE